MEYTLVEDRQVSRGQIAQNTTVTSDDVSKGSEARRPLSRYVQAAAREDVLIQQERNCAWTHWQ
jgi:hypothetical protein